jgi:hypothetical protein
LNHPYSDLSATHFWQKSVANIGLHEIDPMAFDSFGIEPHHKVSTIGSCFAQHLSRFLKKSGFNYLVTEPGPEGLAETSKAQLGYGVFSARYGNVYTVRQANQLFDRAFGIWEPRERDWRLNGSWIDPFRPRVQPGGFTSHADLLADRKSHLDAVRLVFQDSDVLVFTLGLTEAWCSTTDDAVFPIVPGASGGIFSQSNYKFHNFTFNEVDSDLDLFVRKIKRVNPSVKLILTVSPVPLIATYTPKHVLSATTYSKSVLRAVAGEMEQKHKDVHYFPSFEIITGIPAGNQYFEPDLRSVTELGVIHVMRVFAHHYMNSRATDNTSFENPMSDNKVKHEEDVICDEEALNI